MKYRNESLRSHGVNYVQWIGFEEGDGKPSVTNRGTARAASGRREPGRRGRDPLEEAAPWRACAAGGGGTAEAHTLWKSRRNPLTRLSLRPSRARRPPIGWTSRKSADAERRGSANIQGAGSERGGRFLFRRRQTATVSLLHSDPILFITLIPLGCGVCLQVCFLE